MKNKKRIILIVGLSLSLIVFSDNITKNLEGLFSDAYQNALEFKIDALEKEIQVLKVKDAKEAAQKRNFINGNPVDDAKNTAFVKVTSQKIYNEQKYHEFESESNKVQLKVDVEKLLLDYKLLKTKYPLTAKMAAYYDLMYQAEKIKLDKGLITNVKFLEAEQKYQEYHSDLINLKSSLDMSKLALEQRLGQKINGEIEYSMQIKPQINEAYNNPDLALKYLKNNLDYMKQVDGQELSQVNFDIYKEYYKLKDVEYKRAYVELERESLNLKDDTNKRKLGLESEYNKLKVLYKSYMLSDESLKVYQKKHTDLIKKFKYGQISKLELTESENALNTLKIKYYESIVAYNKAFLDYTSKTHRDLFLDK